MAAYDLVVRNAMIVDGTGAAPFAGDIAVSHGKIMATGRFTGGGDQEIDAAGQFVTPGFVDIHTHYDGQVTWEHRLAPSSNHGVTTVVMGNCGVGFAPIRKDQHQMAIQLMEGVEDIPGAVMAEGLPWNWESFPEYLDAIEQRHTDVDFAAQLPHSPLRVFVMGERGVNLEPPTEHDLAEMRRLTKEAIEAGALGVTSSRLFAHRFKDGRPAPSTKTEDTELLAIVAGLRDAGDGVFQIIMDSQKDALQEFDLLCRITEASGRPTSFSFFRDDKVLGGWRNLLDRIQGARKQGLDIKGQFYPRPVGMLFGMDLSFHPFSLNPSYEAIAELPLAERVAAMRNPEMCEKILSETASNPNPFFLWLVSQTEQLFELGDPPNYHPSIGESIGARAKVLGIDPRRLVYDALLKQDGHAIIYWPMGNVTSSSGLNGAKELFGEEGLVLGLADGGAHYGMICDSSYPTFLLQTYVHRSEGGVQLDLATAVNMMSRAPAEAVGLRDRGVIAPGYKADLNIIDLDRIKLHAPRVVRDLPAGGKRLSQGSEGYVATIVNGVVTYREGVHTGALPGRLVRGSRGDPQRQKAAA
jgi:N-acyl-D-aspartate/D-glutamate deacylase